MRNWTAISVLLKWNALIGVVSIALSASAMDFNDLKSRFEKIKNDFEKNPSSEKAIENASELGELNNSDASGYISKNIKPAFASEFRKFHLKMVEIREARQQLLSCAVNKDGAIDPFLEEKAVAIADGAAMGLALTQTEDCPHCSGYTTAVNGIDQTSTACAGGVGGPINDFNYLSTSLYQDSLDKNRPVTDHSYADPSLQILKKQESTEKNNRSTKTESKTDEAYRQMQNTQSWSPAISSYVRDKYGFNAEVNSEVLTNNSLFPQKKIHEAELQEELMKGNRTNAFKNYLYYTQRFNFSGSQDLTQAKDPKEALHEQAKTLLGKERTGSSAGQTLSDVEIDRLSKEGTATLAEFKNKYKGQVKLSEDDVLNRLEEVFQAYQTVSAEDLAPIGLASGGRRLSDGMHQDLKKAEAVADSEEVGFLVHTQAFQSNIKDLANPHFNQDKKREIIRSALLQTLDKSHRYANWIQDNQSDFRAYGEKKTKQDYDKTAKLLLYSSPGVIQETLSKAPYLLGRLCEPLKKAAAELVVSKVPDWVTWGGGGMMFLGPVGQGFGLAIAGGALAYERFEANNKIEHLKEEQDFSNIGSDQTKLENQKTTRRYQKEVDHYIDVQEDAIQTANNTFVGTLGSVAAGKVIAPFLGPTLNALVVKFKLSKDATAKLVQKITQLEKSGKKLTDAEKKALIEKIAEDDAAQASGQVSKTKISQKYTPDTNVETKQYAQDFYSRLKLMGKMEPLPTDPALRLTAMKNQVQQVLNDTNIEDLKKIETIATKRQITRYEDAKKQVEALRAKGGSENLARADKIEAILKSDGIATGNGPHVQEVLNTLTQNEASIKQMLLRLDPNMKPAEMDHFFQYMKTLVSVHDLGKTFTDPLVMKVAQNITKEGGNAFITGKITFHELSSAVNIDFITQANHIDPKVAESLMRNILGHNEGSGLPGVWWNVVAHPTGLLGEYPLPTSFPSQLMALVDRGGQGTLGSTGGVMKIANQIETQTNPFSEKLLEKAMKDNADMTMKQINVIVKEIGNSAERTPLVKTLLQQQQESIDAFQCILWDANPTTGTILGKHFENKQEFFKIVNETEEKIKNGSLPNTFWKDQPKAKPL